MNVDFPHEPDKWLKLPKGTLVDIKVPLHLDGDVASFIHNCVAMTLRHTDRETQHTLGLHEFTEPKLVQFMRDIEERIDPDNWPKE